MTRREFFAHRGFVTSSIGLYLREIPGDGSTLFAAPVQMVAMDSDPRVGSQEPFLRITYDEAQRLVDELWQCGVRPSEGTGSAGSLAATEARSVGIKIAKNTPDLEKVFGRLMPFMDGATVIGRITEVTP